MLYCLLIIIIIIGNGLIFILFVVNWKLRIVINMFIINLLVSDVLVGLVFILSWIYIFLSVYIDKFYIVGSYFFYIIVDIFIGIVFILFFIFISIERCYVIVKLFCYWMLLI